MVESQGSINSLASFIEREGSGVSYTELPRELRASAKLAELIACQAKVRGIFGPEDLMQIGDSDLDPEDVFAKVVDRVNPSDARVLLKRVRSLVNTSKSNEEDKSLVRANITSLMKSLRPKPNTLKLPDIPPKP